MPDRESMAAVLVLLLLWPEGFGAEPAFSGKDPRNIRTGRVIPSEGYCDQPYVVVLPDARWLQPYAEMRFTADTRSGIGAQRTIIADNSVGLSLGARAQPFPTEYFFFYI